MPKPPSTENLSARYAAAVIRRTAKQRKRFRSDGAAVICGLSATSRANTTGRTIAFSFDNNASKNSTAGRTVWPRLKNNHADKKKRELFVQYLKDWYGGALERESWKRLGYTDAAELEREFREFLARH